MCLLICMHVHLFHTRPLSRSPPAHFAVCMRPIVCVCFLADACRCMKPCHATVTVASSSGGLNPGPFVLSTPWMTCQSAGRESRAVRSGQWVSQPWAGCLAGTAAPEQINLRCKQPVNSTDLNYLSFLVYQIRSYQRMKGRLKSNL